MPSKNTQVILSPSSVIELHGNLCIGGSSVRGSKVLSRLIVGDYGRFCVNKKCDILECCDIQIHKGGIFTVDDFHSNIDLEVSCGNQIRLVGDVSAGRHVRLKDYNGHTVSYEKYPISKAIVIENHVWLCTGATVNPGVHIESGCVIADNSNVTDNMPANSFVQGNPAKVVAGSITFKM